MATENKYQKSIDRLNQAIGKEIATTLQYLYFHVHFEDDGYEYFSKMMKQTSITEMFHTDKIADRILFLQGEVEMMPSFEPRKVPAPDAEPVLTHKVAYSDIDFNRHVNTMRYIEMMLDVLPIERFAEERPLRLDINFLKEARYGQTLSVALEERGSQTLVEIRSDAGAALCRGAFEWR